MDLCDCFFELEAFGSQSSSAEWIAGSADLSRVGYAWTKSKDDDALARAENLFNTMQESFDLDRAAYHGLLLIYKVRGNHKKARRLLQKMLDLSNVEPDKKTFTIVIDAYRRSKSANAGERAEDLLDQMRQLHAAGNNDVEVSLLHPPCKYFQLPISLTHELDPSLQPAMLRMPVSSSVSFHRIHKQ